MFSNTDELSDFKLLFDKVAQFFEGHVDQRQRLANASVEGNVAKKFWNELGLYEVFCDPDFTRLASALSIVAHSCGRYLVPAPLCDVLLASAVAGRLSNHEALSSEKLVEPCITLGDQAQSAALTVSGALDSSVVQVSGVLRFVSSVPLITQCLCPYPGSPERSILFSMAAEGVAISNDSSLDGLFNCVRIDLNNVEGKVIDYRQHPLANYEYLARAAELLGLAEFCLYDCAEYVKTRAQFGSPIGSFQAVQHKLADALVYVESLHALVQHAAIAIDEKKEDATLAVLSARQRSLGVVAVLENVLQMYGGIGFTWEHDLHLYLRRAKALAIRYRMSSADYQGILDAVA
jgi:hypothetical protein